MDVQAHVSPPAESANPAARVLLFGIRVYQTFLSALMPSACKFYPSCSHYAAEAVRVHGARRGSWLAMKRIARCHPFTRGGVDLVPEPPYVTTAEGGESVSSAVEHHNIEAAESRKGTACRALTSNKNTTLDASANLPQKMKLEHEARS